MPRKRDETPISILLVEDNAVDVEAVRRAFAKRGLTNPLHVAQNGLEALRLLRDETSPIRRPLLVLLDLNMPQMNGIEFLGAIRADAKLKNTVVFVLTTSAADRDKCDCYAFNVAGYMVKSNMPSALIDRIAMLEHYSRVVEFPPAAC